MFRLLLSLHTHTHAHAQLRVKLRGKLSRKDLFVCAQVTSAALIVFLLTFTGESYFNTTGGGYRSEQEESTARTVMDVSN